MTKAFFTQFEHKSGFGGGGGSKKTQQEKLSVFFRILLFFFSQGNSARWKKIHRRKFEFHPRSRHCEMIRICINSQINIYHDDGKFLTVFINYV
jgi:hypothetical protein